MNPEPEPQTFAERNPQAQAQGTTLRERLDSVGRLGQFEAEGAQRRRERALNPQILDEDTYRARQKLATQMVLNQYLRPETAQPKLTGEGHSNPTVEAGGGKVGSKVKRTPIPIGVNVRQELDSFIK